MASLYTHYLTTSPYESGRLSAEGLRRRYALCERLSLPVITSVPFDELPKRLKEDPRKSLFDTAGKNTPMVQMSWKELSQPTCPATPAGFRYALLHPEVKRYMNITAYYVENELIGVAKHYGSPLFLGLTALKNGAFTTVVPGGVYAIRKTDTARNPDRFVFGRKSIDSFILNLRPRRMLYKSDSKMRQYLREELPVVKKNIKRYQANN